jgi:hypothetical protein
VRYHWKGLYRHDDSVETVFVPYLEGISERKVLDVEILTCSYHAVVTLSRWSVKSVNSKTDFSRANEKKRENRGSPKTVLAIQQTRLRTKNGNLGPKVARNKLSASRVM